MCVCVCICVCIQVHMLRVSDQNGISLLYIMLEIHHSGWEPSCESMLNLFVVWVYLLSVSPALEEVNWCVCLLYLSTFVVDVVISS